jgi:hypothetical protein
LMSKPCGGHAPWLVVGVAVASGDGEDHPTAKSAELLVLSAVVPRTLSDTEALQGVDKEVSKPGSSWHTPWVHPSSAI